MTEVASVHSPADFQPGQPVSTVYAQPPRSNTIAYSPSLEDAPADDDSSEIRCFCEDNKDDGNTVLCEECNTWQHISCYYPTLVVPDLHVCNICHPRPVDKKGAIERQRQARITQQASGGKIKKPPAKSHKKKIRDPNQAPQTNGWTAGSEQNLVAERSGAQEQPPTKRAKTNHRSSSSTSALVNPASGQSRKRATSTTLGAQSPTKSPRSPTPTDYAGEIYSDRFMHISQTSSEYTATSTNSYASLDVSNDLHTWLNDGVALQEVAPGLTQHLIFSRWDKDMDELKHTAPAMSPCRSTDVKVAINGQHPIHNWWVVNEFCDTGKFLGELNGHVGRQYDYKNDPRNRWNELRHPEPFVFFLDKLPIYIDCREEGNSMRYVRRSCRPNTKIQIILHNNDFHFCFVAMNQIGPNEEITLPWSIRGKELETICAINNGQPVSRVDEVNTAQWFTRVAADCGGCACAHTQNPCGMAKFDKRNVPPPATNGHPPKPGKQRKTKKGPAAQISPLSTGRATNSRANSEAVNRNDNEDDDSRSVSNSSRSKPPSRDITPNTNDAVGLGVGMELSDRERRKLLQQERLFEKMEEEKGGKKKRTSAGSALNTPSLSVSKQLGLPDSIHPSPTSATSNTSRPRTNGTGPRMSINGAVAVPRKRPAYSDACTQTEVAKEEPPNQITLRRRAQGSYAQRLLWRVREESRRRKERSLSVASQEQKLSMSPKESLPPPLESKTEVHVAPVALMAPPPLPASATADSSTSPTIMRARTIEANEQPNDVEMADDDIAKDVEMKDAAGEPKEADEPMADAAAAPDTDADADADADAEPDSATPTPVKNETLASPSSSPVERSAEIVQPSDPPLRRTPSKSPTDRKAALHVILPPVPSFSAPSQTETPPTPGAIPSASSMSGASIAQSPSSLHPPLFSPSVQNSLGPSPPKKKLSLSDYTKRKSQGATQATATIPPSTSLANAMTAPISPTEEKKVSILQQTASSVIEEVDMPLAPIRHADEDGTVSPQS
ncbi:hypothetical protein E6O75_ATG03048 [Venturia nashicola]|uniref:SET domain-containing protein n=1 Tax=Venturia nashicola TaxID=86259 RepID=A0A4Z1PLM0_9PEZI|nr:hypothetical protein E6O75_ATG03048 [Venturia nashicola]